MKKISILGSTGSIGTQTLEVLRELKDNFEVVGLSTNNNIDLLEEQIKEFRPKVVAVYNENKAKILKDRLKGYNVDVESGMSGLLAVAVESSDILVTSVVGMVGLLPTLQAIRTKKTIALANKETLVTAGHLVMKEAYANNVSVLPVDSEHSAIFQCLQGNNYSEISKLILTASGGPFRGKKTEDLKTVSLEDALKHPNWNMGKKITIDSATLMNKGLEVIEAKWLFNIDVDRIEVIVHPESIIHSMVEYIDGSIIAQLGLPDMKVPIQYALTYPNRMSNNNRMSFSNLRNLSFEMPDMDTFKCLKLAIDSIKLGDTTMTSVLNGANEAVVDLFLQKKINFIDIPNIIEETLSSHDFISNPSLEEILESDRWAKRKVYGKYSK